LLQKREAAMLNRKILESLENRPGSKIIGVARGQAGWEGKSYKLLNLPIRDYLDLLIK
jgi:hypothetical protein